jgi:hypothetical protein
MITNDDISALVVLADRHAPFQSHLKKDYIDLRWILDRDEDGTLAPTPVSRALGMSVATSPLRSETSKTPSPSRSQLPLPSDEESAHNASRLSSSTPSPHAISGAFASPMSRPPPLRTLADLDVSKSVETISKAAKLITSPRSVLVVLRNGFCVGDLLGVPQKKIRDQALLDGASKEAVKMRLEADANRRQLRREMLLAEYQDLTAKASREEVIKAMREQFFATLREDKRNLEANQRSLDPLVPVDFRTSTLLDDDSVGAIRHNRAAAAHELSRVVDHHERQKTSILTKEEELLRQQAALAGDAKESNIHRDRLLAAKRSMVHERIQEAQERASRLIDAEKAKLEQRRRELEDRRELVDGRATQQRQLTRIATKALSHSQQARRVTVRQQERDQAEIRLEELETRRRFKELLLERTLAQRDSTIAQRRREAELRDKERTEHLKAVAELDQARREAANAVLMATAEKRAEDIVETRLARRETKRARAALKRERQAATQALRAVNEQRRLAELDALTEHKQRLIANAEEERTKAVVAQHERMALVRQERESEQQRAVGIAEFRYVGYVNSNLHKTDWLEREAEKRRTLGLQLRQEREAMARSKDEMLAQLEVHEHDERRRLELRYR